MVGPTLKGGPSTLNKSGVFFEKVNPENWYEKYWANIFTKKPLLFFLDLLISAPYSKHLGTIKMYKVQYLVLVQRVANFGQNLNFQSWQH